MTDDTVSTQEVTVNLVVKWIRLKNSEGKPFKWGDSKSPNIDPNWSKRNVIYRWRKNSTGQIAQIGETERALTDRANNYLNAKPESSAGAANKKVYSEQHRLATQSDCLYVEFTDEVLGYDLRDDRERKLAESLLIGFSRPYLQ